MILTQKNNITINIASGNSTGLSNDALLISDSIKTHFPKITLRHFSGASSKFTNILLLLVLLIDKYILRKRQVTLHLEEIYSELYRFSNQNILIPNQEWLRSNTQSMIGETTLLWCKTHYACRQLQSLSQHIEYLGFSSLDRFKKKLDKTNQYIHVAGKSDQKGTLPVLETWSNHPEWPLLIVISRNKEYNKFNTENIKVYTEFLSEEKLSQLMNESLFHLCPSESEGFGHNIVEALSTGAIVISTNAPPMNELVSPDYGFLVNWNESKKQYFSEMYYIDKIHLELVINQTQSLTHQEIIKLQHNSREFYLQNKNNFADNLYQKVLNL